MRPRTSWRSPDGSIEIRLADARAALPALPAASVDLIFTDPPYGHDHNRNDLFARREKALGQPAATVATPIRPILNDDYDSANQLAAFLFQQAPRLLKPGACCCCCCGGGGPDPQFARWCLWLDGEPQMQFEQMIIWDKGPIGMGWRYRRSYEAVLVAFRKGAKCRWFDSSHRVENIIRPGDYGIRKIIPRADQHPTAKPPELAAHFLGLHTRPGDLVLDPFCGGGSTAVAAARLGRRFLGFELDRAHYERSIEAVAPLVGRRRRPARAAA